MNPPPIILIIDDDADDRELLIEALQDIDPSSDCLTAINGQDGLVKLDTKSIPFPSLIFLDLNMPRIDGRKFLMHIKRDPNLSSIPVIIYTTSSNPNDIEDMAQLGATDYLVKQFDYSILKEKLRNILSMVSST